MILKKATELELQKDEYYLEAGEIARQFGFILDGIARVCYYNNRAEEITKFFIEENNILVDLTSFDNAIIADPEAWKVRQLLSLNIR